MQFNKEELVKSPLNYVGGKYKLLPQILPLLPDNINTFVDLFAGGCNVGINVRANRIICNDIISQVIEFCQSCKELDSLDMIDNIHKLINKYELSKTNQEGYLKLREEYNNSNKNWDMFYTLVCYAFNNQIRFNKNNQFNMPFGKDRSSFNPVLENKFIEFVNHLKTINIQFITTDYKKLSIDLLKSEDFVYADPPYLVTCASYNEQNGWNESHERDLLELLDKIHEEGVKFALSNVLESKGKSNDILKEWSKQYIVHELNYNYKNCNYQLKDKISVTREVLITNY